MSGFNILSQAVAETAFIHLRGATGDLLLDDGKPVGVTVYGPASKQFATVVERQSNRQLRRMEENDGKPVVVAPDVRAAELAEDLTELTISLDNFTYPPAADEGKVGAELYRAFYSDTRLGFMAQQVMRDVQNWGKFKAGSATA